MKLYKQKTAVLVVALGLMAAATAQDQATPENQEQPQAQPEQTSESTETIGDRPVPATGNSRFEPSEEVSEDLSISFPADI
ncbi:MAG: hypothetical protein AAFN68_10215 [Pseudomonadota bacterium]